VDCARWRFRQRFQGAQLSRADFNTASALLVLESQDFAATRQVPPNNDAVLSGNAGCNAQDIGHGGMLHWSISGNLSDRASKCNGVSRSSTAIGPDKHFIHALADALRGRRSKRGTRFAIASLSYFHCCERRRTSRRTPSPVIRDCQQPSWASTG
jgi:hypothetical protein